MNESDVCDCFTCSHGSLPFRIFVGVWCPLAALFLLPKLGWREYREGLWQWVEWMRTGKPWTR